MPRRPASFSQADVARALRAVAQVGMHAIVKIGPYGIIWIIPSDANGENPQVVKERVAEPSESVLW